ncbi:MarR family transcriptional regulator [Nocardia tenerifensis]|uniref:MarR family transcriptional regulator n=1 Tax=Nocardia tenerifensis TaxID=228006 RepID=UPI0011B49535|nr:MarR family transcriptional regulator [Nocardia tenerifensis]
MVIDDPPFTVIDGQVLTDASDRGGSGKVGRTAWGRWAVQRILAVAGKPLTQPVLADLTGISQQAVSQALQLIPLVSHGRGGWSAPIESLDAWLSEYPGPKGTVTYWYGLDAISGQAATACELLEELELQSVISGDLAADEYSPWQVPSTALLYVPELVDFTPVGLSPADRLDATMQVVVPDDPTIIQVATHMSTGRRHPTADPAIVLWDLLNTSTGPAADEAAARLKAHIADGAFSD